ncbi:CBS domain-containing protein [Cephalotus follicularis]|uniref:CBS domain-containing protein n=1 Tax=Cephalotus follicularis TaxID=3775 RepID=A0A1Q3CJS6_CEPFO|nr:CBS domain-containing protein [Cephalotus follicularis]
MARESSKLSSSVAYFESIQSGKKLPHSLQETLIAAYARIPVSSFPIGALALGVTGPAAVAWLTVAAVGAAVAGGVAADKGMGKDAPTAADKLGEDFYKVPVEEESFKSTTVIAIQSNELILEVFKRMRDNQIGGLPVVEGPLKKIIGNISIRYIRHFVAQTRHLLQFQVG